MLCESDSILGVFPGVRIGKRRRPSKDTVPAKELWRGHDCLQGVLETRHVFLTPRVPRGCLLGLREVTTQAPGCLLCRSPKQNQAAKGRPLTKMQGRFLKVSCIPCNNMGVWGQVSRELSPRHLPAYVLMILTVWLLIIVL